jgi:hypothetical protein
MLLAIRWLLALGAWVAFGVSLFLPGVWANPLGDWGNPAAYPTWLVLFVRTLVFALIGWPQDVGLALLAVALCVGTVWFLALPFVLALHRKVPEVYRWLSISLLSAWLFPLYGMNRDSPDHDLIGWYVLAGAYTTAFVAFQMPVVLSARRYARLGRGFCAYCGYDLRASKSRCPECGAPIAPRIGSLYAVLKRR